jgi:pilus assembly protein Flp/PilA
VVEPIELNKSWNEEHSFCEQPNIKHETKKQHTNEKGEWIMKKLINFFKDEEGATMVEYGLLVALIAVVCIAGLLILGPKINTLFTDVAGAIPDVPAGSWKRGNELSGVHRDNQKNRIGQAVITKLIRDQQGGILAEYGLLATLIAVACVIAVTALGASLLAIYTSGDLLRAF